MIKLKVQVQIGLLVVIVGICATESFADCAPPAPFRCSLPSSPVAFVGTVISKQDVDLRPVLPPSTNNRGRRLAGDPVPPRDDSYIAVTFRVNEAFRGDFDDSIVIRTDPANSSASYRFEIGHDYLVFADLKNGYPYTNSCTGNRDVATETAFIRELRAARRGSAMSDIFGLVSTRQAALANVTPAANLTVTAKSDAGEYHSLTAVDGTYEFHGLAPGRYSITVQPPPMREISHTYIQDVGHESACRADFELYYTGRITGTVSDGQGHPLAGIISALLIGIDQIQPVSSVAEVVESRFELKQVPPGRYRIRFFPKGRGRIESYYYPGTTSETAAGEVEVGDGTRITGLQFTIP
jgi:hypothetical protein